ncbi:MULTISPECIES: hypothetical protein [Streptomyces]|uniref:YcxB-like protein domain-containing protein n=2 Tax=Streptomyces TaxID=1883 RepID=A0ABU4K731_9ACTN|nr:hypothetical protein [Streptomyces roseolus]MDX2293558.1 hypothetical protein [Streptomyces roseolus]
MGGKGETMGGAAGRAVDPAHPRVRRATIRGGIWGAVVGVAVVPYGLLQIGADLLRFGGGPVFAGAGALVGGALFAWVGARWGRDVGLKDSTLEGAETLLAGYAVVPLEVDGRPGRRSDGERFELRSTTRRLQFWDGTACLWSHPWSAVTLATVKRELLVVRHGDEVIAELTPAHELPHGWDELMLGARRRGRTRTS